MWINQNKRICDCDLTIVPNKLCCSWRVRSALRHSLVRGVAGFPQKLKCIQYRSGDLYLVPVEGQGKRQYFTFPVEEDHMAQISCAQGECCGWGTHRHQGCRLRRNATSNPRLPKVEIIPELPLVIPLQLVPDVPSSTGQRVHFEEVYFTPSVALQLRSLCNNGPHLQIQIRHRAQGECYSRGWRSGNQHSQLLG